MAITFKNGITRGSDVERNVVGELYLPMHTKYTNHLKRGESDSIEWGIGGNCDDKKHKVKFKVNLVNELDEHPTLGNVKSGDTVIVKYDEERDSYYIEKE